jgi:Cu+-exporting ATPase
MGLKVVMFTGDNEKTAKVIAKELGITDMCAGLEPKDKQELAKQFQVLNKRVVLEGICSKCKGK